MWLRPTERHVSVFREPGQLADVCRSLPSRYSSMASIVVSPTWTSEKPACVIPSISTRKRKLENALGPLMVTPVDKTQG